MIEITLPSYKWTATFDYRGPKAVLKYVYISVNWPYVGGMKALEKPSLALISHFHHELYALYQFQALH